ncbi:hypothetical protein JXA84_02695 [candidate division WOR-3 bacterium]|nr:hypothetical protein [candidate division WOR-3 bacterium]
MKIALNFSIILILAGVLFWLSNFGYLSFKRDWPVALVVLGLDLFIITLIGIIKKKKVKKSQTTKDSETEGK